MSSHSRMEAPTPNTRMAPRSRPMLIRPRSLLNMMVREIICHPELTHFSLDYATIKVCYNPDGNNGGPLGQYGEDACKGQDNLFERSCDGRIVETYLHDGTKVCGYKESTAGSSQGEQGDQDLYTHLIYGYDGSVLKVREDGEVVIVAENDRHALAQEDPEAAPDMYDGREWLKPNEKSYFSQLFCSDEDRRNGVFAAQLTQCKRSFNLNH